MKAHESSFVVCVCAHCVYELCSMCVHGVRCVCCVECVSHVYGVCTHIVCVYVWGLVLTLTVSRHCAVT